MVEKTHASQTNTATTTTPTTTEQETNHLSDSTVLSRCNFPNKVYRMLEYAHAHDLLDICSWEDEEQQQQPPHGSSSFIISNVENFMKVLASKFFPNQSSFRSFERQLNSWGFVRKTPHALKQYSFQHPWFVRNRPDWISKITRVGSNNNNNKTCRRIHGISIKLNLPSAEARQSQRLALNFIQSSLPPLQQGLLRQQTSLLPPISPPPPPPPPPMTMTEAFPNCNNINNNVNVVNGNSGVETGICATTLDMECNDDTCMKPTLPATVIQKYTPPPQPPSAAEVPNESQVLHGPCQQDHGLQRTAVPFYGISTEATVACSQDNRSLQKQLDLPLAPIVEPAAMGRVRRNPCFAAWPAILQKNGPMGHGTTSHSPWWIQSHHDCQLGIQDRFTNHLP